MKNSFITTVLLFLSQVSLGQSNDFNETLTRFLQLPEYKNATVGMEIVELPSGRQIYKLNSEKLMIPASALKLFTSATALEILGSDYRFETQIGYTGVINDSILLGDLVLIGGGDPTLGSEYFEDYYFEPHFLDTWVEQIKNYGIKKIEGDLVLDLSLYDSEINPPTWVWEDIGNYYGAGSSALTVYDNLFRITFRSPQMPGQQTEIIGISPEVPGINFKNEVLSADINYDQAYVFGSPLDFRRVVRGAIPANRSSFTIKAALPQPEKLLAADLIKRMENTGIYITGNTEITNSSRQDYQIISTQYSPPLADIVQVLNFESVNLFAEHLVRQIAAEVTGTGAREKGIEIIKDFWKSRGLDKETWFMEDGSGLSHFNAISPRHFTQLLTYMGSNSQSRNAFLNSLALPGEGTLIYWDKQRFPENVLRVKSGSMTRVRCYAGYIELDSGKTAAFAIMVNHFAGGHAKLIYEIEDLLFSLKTSY